MVASCATAALNPCDFLVPINTQPSTNRYLVENDRPAAIGLARHKQRLVQYKCATEEKTGDLIRVADSIFSHPFDLKSLDLQAHFTICLKNEVRRLQIELRLWSQ